MLVLIGRWGKEGRGRLSDLLCSAAFFYVTASGGLLHFYHHTLSFKKDSTWQSCKILMLLYSSIFGTIVDLFVISIYLNFIKCEIQWNVTTPIRRGSNISFFGAFYSGQLVLQPRLQARVCEGGNKGVKINDAKKETLLPQTIEILQ